jgi:ABC-2 type transport system permease protein
VALLAWWWVAALGRQLTTVDASTEGAAVRRRRWNPSGQLGGVVVKELAYMRREPRRTIAVLSPVVVTIILAISWGRQGVSPVVPVAFGASLLGMQTINPYGLDGQALWINVLAWDSPRRVRTDLAGRQLTYLIVATPTLAAMAVLSGILADRPEDIVPAVIGGLTLFGIILGGGALNSVLLPMTVPDRGNPFGGSVTGQGCVTSLGSMALVGIAVVLSLPILLPAGLDGPLWVVLLGIPYAVAVAWLGRLAAASIAATRLPEIHTAVTREV